MKQAPEETRNGFSDKDSIMAQKEVEADLFCFDDNNKEEEELMIGVVLEEELQIKQTQAEKAGKRKNNEEKDAVNSALPSKQGKKTVGV
eukprot:3721300-Ditylum_brightwellii.AAC.1